MLELDAEDRRTIKQCRAAFSPMVEAAMIPVLWLVALVLVGVGTMRAVHLVRTRTDPDAIDLLKVLAAVGAVLLLERVFRVRRLRRLVDKLAVLSGH